MSDIMRTEALSFSYPSGARALSGISLGIPKGRKTVFLGPNGSGKSTLFLCLNGVNRPDSGKVLFAGRRISYGSGSLQALREKVVLVFQNPDDQIFSATVEEDVAFGPLNLGLPKEEVARRVDEAISWAGIEDLRERPTQQLSFGQRKRVSLAGALAMKPELLIMDEPTAGLDSEMVHELLELSDELNHKGLTVAMSTHDIETAYEWADEVRALRAGRLAFSGKPEEFFAKDSLIHSLGLAMPMPFLLNRQMHLRTGKPENPSPRNIVQLLQKAFPARRVPGTITIRLAGEAGRAAHEKSGVYGSHARRLARLGKLDVHYRFHAIESAILEAAAGRDFALYTDAGLVPLLKEKLANIEKLAGRKIRLRIGEN